MEWSDIRVFLQVVRDGTMQAATGSLRLDHSTISRRISRLEREAGVTLFERAGRRLALTAEGEKLVVSAEKVESIVLREVMNLSGEMKQITGHVRIGTTEEFGAHYLAPRLSRLTDTYPDLEIELVASTRTLSLATREVDCVVTLDRPLQGDVRYKKLIDFEFGVYAASSYFGEKLRPTSVEDLSSETWCDYIRELLSTSELDVCAAAGIDTLAKFRTTSVSLQLGAALGGYALAALPCFVASQHASLERVLTNEARYERTYWIAVHEDLAKRPRVRAVMAAIEEEVERDKALFKPRISSATASGVPIRLPETGDFENSHAPSNQIQPTQSNGDAGPIDGVA
jgi:DNA-binding transcriptional LysR family regulator